MVHFSRKMKQFQRSANFGLVLEEAKSNEMFNHRHSISSLTDPINNNYFHLNDVYEPIRKSTEIQSINVYVCALFVENR